MPKNSKLAAPTLKAISGGGLSLKDPRVAMRVLIGVLLAANLGMAVVAFKPFGGSADDLRQEQQRLSAQLRQLQISTEQMRQHVAKIDIARTQGDEFLAKYIMDRRSAAATMYDEMSRAATDAGVRPGPGTYSEEVVEGSDTLQWLAYTAAFDGTYANLAKLVNVLDKSGRFLIIDTMNLNAPQQQSAQQQTQGQVVSVTMKLLTLTRDDAGAGE